MYVHLTLFGFINCKHFNFAFVYFRY